MSDLVLTFSKQWTSCYFSGQQCGFFFPYSLPRPPACYHLVFLNNGPLQDTCPFAFFLGSILPKICLGCGTFQCFTDEVSFTIPSLEMRKLNHRKETGLPKS